MSQTQNQNRPQENDERAYGRENGRTRWGSSSQLDPQLFGGRGGAFERDFRSPFPFGGATPQSFDTRETLGRVLGRVLGDREVDLQLALQVLDLLRGHEAEADGAYRGRRQHLLVDRVDLAFDLDLDRRVGGEEQVGRLALHHELEQRLGVYRRLRIGAGDFERICCHGRARNSCLRPLRRC